MHPLPVSLPKECRKAEKIIKSFMESSRNGLDGVRDSGPIIARYPQYRTDAARWRARFIGFHRLFPVKCWRTLRDSAYLLSSKLALCSLPAVEVESSLQDCQMVVR
jgi:hypothetical protein